MWTLHPSPTALISFIITLAGLQLEHGPGFLFVGRNSYIRSDQTSNHSKAEPVEAGISSAWAGPRNNKPLTNATKYETERDKVTTINRHTRIPINRCWLLSSVLTN